MPRPPYDAAKAKRLLAEWIVQRIPKTPEDAPINIPAAVAYLTQKGLSTHKATLHKYDLNALVADGARRQREEGGGSRALAERAGYDDQMRTLRAQLAQAETRTRELLAVIATMRYNSRNRIPEPELMKPIPTARAHRQSSPPPAKLEASSTNRGPARGRKTSHGA